MMPEKGILLATGSNGSIGTVVMQRFAGRFEPVVYSGPTARGQSLMHMDDVVDAIDHVVDRGSARPRGDSKETIKIPGPVAPVAKAGAWVLATPGHPTFSQASGQRVVPSDTIVLFGDVNMRFVFFGGRDGYIQGLPSAFPLRDTGNHASFFDGAGSEVRQNGQPS
jgi:hypothetical protein